jgi:16S rRNA (cytosine1402-N4)-methyltransferase
MCGMKKQRNDKSSTDTAYHVPVLLHETIDGLNIQPNGSYVDCTFGGGGHAREILKRLAPAGRLIAFDQDADAKQNVPADNRVIFLPHNFRHLQRFLKVNRIATVDGIVADLGVSSHQFDEGERGFSTRFEGDMDMRMDQRQDLKAVDIIMNFSEDQLHKLFESYGEVTNAKTLARTIVDVRQHTSLKTISNFKQALSKVVKGNPNKYFAQVFQALRIEVNDEFGALKELLQQSVDVLHSDGRVAIITFHSLEDRLVKQFFKKGKFDEEQEYENPFVQSTPSPFKLINKKPIQPSPEEIKRNPRSRSARLRIAEKI